MANTCAWSDCRSDEVQAHHVTLQCLSCGRHSNLTGQPVEWVVIPEQKFWKVVGSGEAVSEGA